MKFDKLARFLTENGYYVRVRKVKEGGKFSYWYGIHSSPQTNIVLAFCEPNEAACYSYINGKIAADHYQCFDKWSKCPVVLPFPHGREQKDFLLESLSFLSSQEGYKWSNTYAYLDEPLRAYP